MKHIRVVSRASIGGSIFGSLTSGLDLAETLVIALLTIFFSGWDNFRSVITNLQKYYRKV